VEHLPRRDEITICRLHVEHTHLAYSYILHKEDPPECGFCHLPLTVEHILITCLKHDSVRESYFDVSSLEELFDKINIRFIIDFVKCTSLLKKL
jgi:phenylalanine-4-hydroxylase